MNQDLDWGLEDLLRFPSRTEGWNEPRDPIVIRSSLKFGASSDGFAFASARSQLALQLTDVLVREKEHDFRAAACNLPPDSWRLLFYRAIYTIDALSSVGFSADAFLRKQCHPADEFEDPPSCWLGEDVLVESLVADTEVRLRELGPDGCAAVFTVLALVQLVGLSRAEILRCEWWNPMWVSQLTRNVRFVP